MKSKVSLILRHGFWKENKKHGGKALQSLYSSTRQEKSLLTSIVQSQSKHPEYPFVGFISGQAGKQATRAATGTFLP
jgi:hypothetical protein